MAVEREKGNALAWDEKNSLHLYNRTGVRQAQTRLPGCLTDACSADDGSAYAAVGDRGEVWWLAPDLTVRWERTVAQRVVAAALDPLGQYLAVSDAHGIISFFDRYGRVVSTGQSPRPLQHIAFVPSSTFLVGCADFGLVACFDLAGRCVWRDGLVADIGSLGLNGDGSIIVLACFTEGLQRYNLAGKNMGRAPRNEPCRLVALSFSGERMLVAGLSHRLELLDGKGRTLGSYQLEKPPVALCLGPLGDYVLAALPSGRILAMELGAPG
jgi:hypothetical protein